jgi:hypothetical protein
MAAADSAESPNAAGVGASQPTAAGDRRARARNPSLSVIIPNFNYGRFLRACLDSALALEYEPKEIIVVDDGSTDDSAAILREYEAAGRIRAVFQRNAGQPTAVSRGFAASSGEIVYVLDSDDLVLPHMMRRVLTRWRPGLSKLQFCLESVDEQGQPVGSVFPNYAPHASPATLWRSLTETGEYQAPPTSGNVYARWYLEKLFPLDERRFRFSDGPLNAVAPLYGDVEVIPEALSRYRMHGSNAWGRRDFDPRIFTNAVVHNLALDEFILEHAQRLGLSLSPNLSDRAPWALQYRMASLRLRFEQHPLAESAGEVMSLGIAAVRHSATLSAAQKATLVPWFILMAVAPSKLAEELTKLRFVPTARAPWLGKALRALGALKRNTQS